MNTDPEEWLGSLDPIGWRFGLDRIGALLSELGDPQHEFEPIHVVGTNGKSSVTIMTAALVEAAGRRTGAYLSPHRDRWAQRIQVGGEEVGGDEFARAAGRVAEAAAAVERGFADGERVTQFEAATAVAFVALAEAGVEVGVIEAGLGGRLDATNVLASRATALTSIGLDHTAWLGETELEIAAEKLAVLRKGTVLVTGRLSPEVRDLARETAERLGCRLVEAPEAPAAIGLAAPYLRRNLGVALEAASVVAEVPGEEGLVGVLAALDLPGRFEWEEGDPPIVMDAAHNAEGAAALAEALIEAIPGSPVVAALAILADKDAGAIVRALAPGLTAAVCTEIPPERLAGAGRPGITAVSASELVALCEANGVPATANRDPGAAIALASAFARERDGVALVAGSHYLLGYRWIAKPGQSSSR